MHKHKKAFTLIELLIVITIIGIMTGVVISGISNSRVTMTFLGAQETLFSAMRTARTYAVTGRSVPDYTDYDGDGDSAEQVTPANWGIAGGVNAPASCKKKIFLFADLRSGTGSGSEGTFQCPGSGQVGVFSAGNDLVLAEYSFDEDIDIKILPLSSAINTVLFSPIFADVKFASVSGAATLPSASQFLTIKISSFSNTSLKTCYLIHPVSGNPEPYPSAMTCP